MKKNILSAIIFLAIIFKFGFIQAADFAGAAISREELEKYSLQYGISVDDCLNKLKDAGIKYLRLVHMGAEETPEWIAKLKSMGFELMPTLVMKDREGLNNAVAKETGHKAKEGKKPPKNKKHKDEELNGFTGGDNLHEIIMEWYDKYLIPTVEKYKGSIKYWQVFNEENGGEKFGVNKIAYTLLLTGKAENGKIKLEGTIKNYNIANGAYGIIKQISPKAKVVLGGLAGSAENESYLGYLKANNVCDYVDIIDFHSNFNPNREKGTGEYWGHSGYAQYWWKLNKGIDTVREYLCTEKPVWVTEIGAVSSFKYIEAGPGKNSSGYSMTTSMDFQADDVIKRYVSMLYLGIEKGFWNPPYDFAKEKKSKGGKISCDQLEMQDGWYVSSDVVCKNGFKGIILDGLKEKPSFAAYKILTQKLNGVQKVVRMDDPQGDVFIFKAVFPDGSKKFIAWCEPFLNDDFSQGKAWNYEDKDCTRIIDLKEEFAASVNNVTVTKRNGEVVKTTPDLITITKSPVFIE